MNAQARDNSLVAAAQARRSLPILSVVAVLATLAGMHTADAAELAPAQTAATSSTSDSMPIEEVTVVAHKLDQHKLDHVIIPRFVQSHGAPNPKSHQVGRWTRPAVICLRTVGLKPAAADYLSHRIMTVAAYVGAPTAVKTRCQPSVEIIFTPDPQAQITHFGKTYPAILGYAGKSRKELLTVRYPIQAWYTTVTHTDGGGWIIDTDRPNLGSPYFVNSEALGMSSRLSVGMVSGFGNVLVVADAKQVSGHSLGSITDYIAMLVLTRTSVDGCSELPSIMDLLSPDCAGRAPPNFITGADVAYLKALYSANLEMNLNLERGDMHDLMLQEVLGH